MISILSLAKKHILGFWVAVAFLFLLSPIQVSAQSLLQNSGGALQPQSGQTQRTNDTQRQASSPQTGENQSLLNNQSSQSLGVVSDPRQSNPDAAAQPSTELRSNDGDTVASDSDVFRYLAGFLVMFLFVVFVAYHLSRFDFEPRLAGEPFDRNQLAESLRNPTAGHKLVKNKKSKKKRGKPHHR